MEELKIVKDLIEKGASRKIEAAVLEAINAGVPAGDIVNQMIDSMGVVGELFQSGEIFVPEMLAAGTAMKKGVECVKPYLKSEDINKKGKFIIGTVTGDLHDIGKNLVALMVEGAGFEVIDLGVDVPTVRFVEAIKDNPDCRVVGISALLTTTMAAMKDTVKAINESGLRDQVKIIIGGAPISMNFAEQIGADAYAPDAASAATKAKELVG